MTVHRATLSRTSPSLPVSDSSDSRLVAADELREAWLAWGLSTEPADRGTAQAAVTELYRLAGRRPPDIVWAPSPPAAIDTAATLGLNVQRTSAGDRYDDARAQVAQVIGAARSRMVERIRRRAGLGRGGEWCPLAKCEIPTIGCRDSDPLIARLGSALWESMRATLVDAVAAPIRRLLPPTTGVPPWYGQQEAFRVGYFTVLRDLGLIRYEARDDHVLNLQADLVRSSGWWWAFDDCCVISDRPRTLSTEPATAAADSPRRLHRTDGPAVEFRDGTRVLAIHGTVVPEWVLTDPTVPRIMAESNVEVRRTAVEQMGWDVFVADAELTLRDRRDDPGNPGSSLELYDGPANWLRNSRILLVVNGSRERDGTRRRYGLTVPAWIDSAIAAAGWTYGLSGDTYAELVRRT